ncbi:MAG: hypothetical protein A3F61_00430 [Candidatus Blackburnbacteria bacterium RIFCSPHIGHO2_12_FULL_41_13b]|uniref:DegT/DnrJ/EryC1/StrS aminotransferase n=1 Tax=Candidatus Blackburnbacteria bacterium RIFCSPHIGHO2_12_FULL_41_13b TaxID=1797517 RepID=A0A1G1VA23_9BACT|nr:MAG: hypothetical protein A3F61_00430 [Candidatus Blackburnbacteria bacterium RIFCSPHIGHO2_12_FULL_41_13b]
MSEFFQKLDLEAVMTRVDIENFNEKLPDPLNRKDVIFTLYGRNALFLGAEAIAEQTYKKVILMPSYSFGDEIVAVKTAGFEPEFYDVDPDSLQVQIKSIEVELDPSRIGCMLLTHYFGFPQRQVKEIQNLCLSRGIYLIEDCAHALGSSIDNQYVGTFGDIAVFSIRKFFPIPHGGALVVNNKKLKVSDLTSPNSTAVSQDVFLMLGYRNGIFKPGQPIDSILGGFGKQVDRHGPRLAEHGGYRLAMSNFAKNAIKLCAEGSSLKTRALYFQNYLELVCRYKSDTFSPVFDNLPEGVIPLFFPLTVDDSEEVNKKLLGMGFDITQPFWSYLHHFIDWEKHLGAKNLKGRILVLPVSHAINQAKLEQLFAAIGR